MNDDQLLRLLSKMNIPDHRKSKLNKSGIEWLYKNLPDRNSQNTHFEETYKEIKRRFEDKIYSN